MLRLLEFVPSSEPLCSSLPSGVLHVSKALCLHLLFFLTVLKSNVGTGSPTMNSNVEPQEWCPEDDFTTRLWPCLDSVLNLGM